MWMRVAAQGLSLDRLSGRSGKLNAEYRAGMTRQEPIPKDRMGKGEMGDMQDIPSGLLRKPSPENTESLHSADHARQRLGLKGKGKAFRRSGKGGKILLALLVPLALAAAGGGLYCSDPGLVHSWLQRRFPFAALPGTPHPVSPGPGHAQPQTRPLPGNPLPGQPLHGIPLPSAVAPQASVTGAQSPHPSDAGLPPIPSSAGITAPSESPARAISGSGVAPVLSGYPGTPIPFLPPRNAPTQSLGAAPTDRTPAGVYQAASPSGLVLPSVAAPPPSQPAPVKAMASRASRLRPAPKTTPSPVARPVWHPAEPPRTIPAPRSSLPTREDAENAIDSVF